MLTKLPIWFSLTRQHKQIFFFFLLKGHENYTRLQCFTLSYHSHFPKTVPFHRPIRSRFHLYICHFQISSEYRWENQRDHIPCFPINFISLEPTLFHLGLHLFRRKIFSTVKCLQMQIISGKMIVFPVFVCILENSLKNIFQRLGQRKMKKRKNHKPLQMQTHHRNPS